MDLSAADAAGEPIFTRIDIAAGAAGDRAGRRRAAAELARLRAAAGPLNHRPPGGVEQVALTADGSFHLSLSREAAEGAIPEHWHLAISHYQDGKRQAVGIEEFAA